MNTMKFMKKTVCSSLVLASFLQTVAPLCAMNADELREGFPHAARPQAAAAKGDVRRMRTNDDLTGDEKDYVFNMNMAINGSFTGSIRALVAGVIFFINDAKIADDQKMSTYHAIFIKQYFDEVEASVLFFKEMKAKYADQREGQHIWTTAGGVYDSFEKSFKTLKGKLPKDEIFSLQEFEAFCQESLKFIENVLVLHRGLSNFPKTGGGFRLHVFPDYEGSPSDSSTEESYLGAWHLLRQELQVLNPEFVQDKMMKINPQLREEIERKRIAAEEKAQAIAAEEQRRLQAAAGARQREEIERAIAVRKREDAERVEAAERVRVAEEAVRRAVAQEAERREAERLLERERARAAEVAAAAQRAAVLAAEREVRKVPLRVAYDEISMTIDAINAITRNKYSDANEGIMKFGDNQTGGGNKLLGRISALLPGLFDLHGLAYRGPVEREFAHRPSGAITRTQDEVVTFFDMLNVNKNIDIFKTIASNFVDSITGNGGHFEGYFKNNRYAGDGFASLYGGFKDRIANDDHIKELSKRIIRFGLADDGHSSRLLHPLLLAKVIWEQRPILRPQVNDMLVSFFSQTAEQSGRCATGATGRTNLMLYQLCGLLLEVPLQP